MTRLCYYIRVLGKCRKLSTLQMLAYGYHLNLTPALCQLSCAVLTPYHHDRGPVQARMERDPLMKIYSKFPHGMGQSGNCLFLLDRHDKDRKKMRSVFWRAQEVLTKYFLPPVGSFLLRSKLTSIRKPLCKICTPYFMKRPPQSHTVQLTRYWRTCPKVQDE